MAGLKLTYDIPSADDDFTRAGEASGSVKKKLRPYISVNKKGVIKIKKWKNAKKGTYKITVKIVAHGNTNYNSKVVTKTLKVRIK